MDKLLSLYFASALLVAAAAPTLSDIRTAIRQDDRKTLHQLISSPQVANLVDGLQATPLDYAAIYGSPEALRFLLEAGSDPNASNASGATALIYAAWSLDRTKILVEHGASVNAATHAGITPLHVAAATHGNVATLRYLLDKGANLQAETDDGDDALMRAAGHGDPDMVQLLLQRGANAKRADKAGFTALQNATTFRDSSPVRLLLAAGADPNSSNTHAGVVKNGPIALKELTPLMTAAPYSDAITIASLLQAGARVNQMDSRHMTPLMFSIATDQAQPATVRQLLAAGADLQPRDIYGATALDWARRFGNPEIVGMLIAAHAPAGEPAGAAPVIPANSAPASGAQASVDHALALFAKSDFFRTGGGCAGCHHQPAYARAYAAAARADVSRDPMLSRSFRDAVLANRSRLAVKLPYLSSFGGDFDSLLSVLDAQQDLNEWPTELTDMMVHFLATRQDASGAWISGGIARPPLEDSTISRTASAIAALRYDLLPARKAEFEARIAKARSWLLHAKSITTYEEADRIRGLHAAGIPISELQADAAHLLALQRPDGGWAQTPYLQSDAYATGMVLANLCKVELLQPGERPYRAGAGFLLRTQYPDGSWYVRSRAPKFQPYFQSGFPFDHDQWISSVGSAWAVIALSNTTGSTLAHR